MHPFGSRADREKDARTASSEEAGSPAGCLTEHGLSSEEYSFGNGSLEGQTETGREMKMRSGES